MRCSPVRQTLCKDDTGNVPGSVCLLAREVSLPDHDPTVAPYRKTHVNHPISIWVRHNESHYNWTCNYGLALCAEYTRRYGKIHKTQYHLDVCSLGDILRRSYRTFRSKRRQRNGYMLGKEYQVNSNIFHYAWMNPHTLESMANSMRLHRTRIIISRRTIKSKWSGDTLKSLYMVCKLIYDLLLYFLKLFTVSTIFEAYNICIKSKMT